MIGTCEGLRLVVPARKSRKKAGKGPDGKPLPQDYERQDHRARGWGEAEGGTIIKVTKDTVSSQSAPWRRKDLGPWMTDPALLALYDALLASELDRVSRGTDEDFHYIENWCYETRKRIIIANGPQFPPRDGPMGESDRYQWIAMKRAARTYWEAVRDKHADTREMILAHKAVIGRPPFGYAIEGAETRKRFVIHPVNGPIAYQMFRRIADGRTATSVAEYMTEATGKLWRVKMVTDAIKRTSYLGERDGHVYPSLLAEAPEGAQGLWDAANAALARRSISTGGRRTVWAYSGAIECECGAPLYHHQSKRNGQLVGVAHYQCARGRRGIAGEAKCGRPTLGYDDTNAAVTAAMAADHTAERAMMTSGGSAAKDAELARIKAEMKSAMDQDDMDLVATLTAKFAEVKAIKAKPVKTEYIKTGRTIAEAWAAGTLADQRAMLGDTPLTIVNGPEGLRATYRGPNA